MKKSNKKKGCTFPNYHTSITAPGEQHDLMLCLVRPICMKTGKQKKGLGQVIHKAVDKPPAHRGCLETRGLFGEPANPRPAASPTAPPCWPEWPRGRRAAFWSCWGGGWWRRTTRHAGCPGRAPPGGWGLGWRT